MPALFTFTALAGLAVGLLGLLWRAEAALLGFGHPALPPLVHAFTLGALLSGHYALTELLWRRCYGERTPWPPLSGAVWVLHTGGLALLLWGWWRGSTELAYWGGHYLVPTGIVVSWVQGGVALWRREPGRPRQGALHVPALGLAVAASLGALLVMDAAEPRYGLYTPGTILVHFSAAGFLFLLPAWLAAEALRLPACNSPEINAEFERLKRRVLLFAGGAGLAVLTLAAVIAGNTAPVWLPAVWLGLGALVFLYGLSTPAEGRLPPQVRMRRAGWLAVGVLLLLTAVRLWRAGSELPGTAGWHWAQLNIWAVVFVLALPELVSRLAEAWRPGVPPRDLAALHGAQWLGTALLLAGVLSGVPFWLRTGAALWLGVTLLGTAYLTWSQAANPTTLPPGPAVLPKRQPPGAGG